MKRLTALARHLDTRAAEELYMAPAHLSIQIERVTQAMGSPLYELKGERLIPVA